MSGEHTPGPWLRSDHLVYALDENNEVNRFSARIDGGHTLYTRRQSAVYPTSQEELAANARLIAAAPELVKALEAVMAEFFPHATPGEYPELADARAVIAKARGAA